MKNRLTTLIVALGLSLAPALIAADAKTAKPPAPGVGDEVLLSVTATVTGLNLETRQLTLKGPAGNTHTITVGPKVERLADIKVGDEIVVDYYAAVAAELRAPTEAEKAEPLAVLKDAAKAPDGSPAAGGYRIIRAIMTVEVLDRPGGTATVKSPSGSYYVVAVKDPSVLPKLKIGDTVVVIYTEALAISVQKAPAHAAAAPAPKAG